MKFDPKEYGIAARFQHWHGDQAEDHLGPFFFCKEEKTIHTAFRVAKQHCNAHESLHGGIMMAFSDYTMCLAANGGAQQSVATVSCNNDFTAPAFLGDIVYGKGEVIRRGRSLVFSRAELRVEDTVILISSGVIKLLAPASS